METYITIIVISLVIIFSYVFNVISKWWNIPSVLLLIGLGIVINQLLLVLNLENPNFSSILETLGTIGLIFIVLEASLDLELTKSNLPIIRKAFLVALLTLIGSSCLIAGFIDLFMDGTNYFRSLIYAIPLSIMSSAIVIPSVSSLAKKNKEFMIYESTFSDILGIMFFYFLLENYTGDSAGAVTVKVVGNILLTLVVSIVIGYLLTVFLQKLKTQVKIFLLLALLMLFYAIGKLLGMSSLVIVLVSGLVMNNYKLFFRGVLKKLIDDTKMHDMLHNFHLITIESAFVIRTFFFVIFGMQIVLSTLVDIRVALYSCTILIILYGVRYGVLSLVKRNNIRPELYIAPRGLITILLFYHIPSGGNGKRDYTIDGFDSGILLYCILISSVIMTIELMTRRKGVGFIKPEESLTETEQHLADVESLLFEDEGIIGTIENEAASENKDTSTESNEKNDD